MKTILQTAVLATTALLLTTGIAQADLTTDAHRVLEHRLSMGKPLTVFDKWQADQWTFLASECWASTPARNPEDKAKLDKLRLYSGGSHRLSEDTAKTCATLAEHGPKPVCFGMSTMSAPFAWPWAGMRSNYLYLAKAELPESGSMHSVIGDCQLVENKPETRQSFAGEAQLLWLTQPNMTSLMTESGPRIVKVGTISFKVQGMPGAPYPTMVLVP